MRRSALSVIETLPKENGTAYTGAVITLRKTQNNLPNTYRKADLD